MRTLSVIGEKFGNLSLFTLGHRIRQWVQYTLPAYPHAVWFRMLYGRWLKYETEKQANYVFSGQSSPALVTAALDFKIDISEKERILSGAERLLQHEYNFLGTAGSWNGKVDWHLDVLSGNRWPVRFYQLLYPLSQASPPADIKIPWELNRCQHWLTLAMAYRLSGDFRYAEAVFAQMQDWLQSNPYPYGINWTCAMEVALRAANWILTVELLGGWTHLPTQLAEQVITSLFYHGHYIQHHIEIYRDGITTNHTLSDYFGLLVLGCALRPAPWAMEWCRQGWESLQREIRVQVTPDGADYEASIPYHRLAFEIFLYGYLIARKAGLSVSADYLECLEKMAEFVMAYTRPDGLAPQVGDNDDGRVFILSDYLGWERRDHRYLLGIAAVLFGRGDFKWVSEKFPLEGQLLLGSGAAAQYEALPLKEPYSGSVAFPHAGFYLLRSSRLWVWVSAHPAGTRGMGNHTHNDLGSFELCVDSKAMIVDPGSYTYTRDPVARYEFRRTKAHNTLVVDGAEQNPLSVKAVFGLPGSYEDPDVLSFIDHQDKSRLIMALKGYLRLADPVFHKRTFQLDKRRHILEIRDEIQAQGLHTYEWYFHLDAGVKCDIHGTDVILTTNGASAKLSAPDGMKPTVQAGWVSYAYNHRLPAQILCFSTTVKGSINVVWKIVPCDYSA